MAIPDLDHCGATGGSCSPCDPLRANTCGSDGACKCGGTADCNSDQRCVDVGGGTYKCVCNAASCATGCCTSYEGGVCITPGDGYTQCGTGGVVCDDCSVTAGNECDGSQVCACKTTGGGSCTGCCDTGTGGNGLCHTSSHDYCGINHVQCDACTVTENCSGSGVCTTITYALTVQKSGTGTGTVQSTDNLINCGSGAGCTHTYDINTVVTLTATEDVSSTFTSWTGCNSTSGNQCTVNMTAAKSVTATFTLKTFTLDAAISGAGTGTGTVTSNPVGVSCPGDCTEIYDYNTVVVLTANAAVSSTFTSWTGCDSTNANQCTVTMTAAKSVTATFTLKTFALSVLTNGGAGAGAVASTDNHIDCGATCTYTYNYGDAVTLNATPDGSSSFAGWLGGGCSGTGSCVVTVTAATTVTATFNNWLGDNNILWDYLYHGADSTTPLTETVPGQSYTFLYPQGGVLSNSSPVDVYFFTELNDVVSAELRVWDGAESIITCTSTASITAAFRGEASHTYALWKGTIPAKASGTIYYRIRLHDATVFAELKVANGTVVNPIDQNIRGADYDPDDYSYIVP